jgi:hypothetical protein
MKKNIDDLNKKLKRSKFAKIIKGLDDEQLQLMMDCFQDPSVMSAINCVIKAVDNTTQALALSIELEKRSRTLSLEKDIKDIIKSDTKTPLLEILVNTKR